MMLLDIKIAMETYFQNNYTATAIHFAGTNFDTSAHTEWVYFEYVGSAASDAGLDNSEYKHEGVIKIVSMAESAFRATQIADIAITLFKGKTVSNMMPREMSIVGQGYDKNLSKSFIDIEIEVTNF